MQYIRQMISDFTIDNIKKISKDTAFMAEFLNLSYVALLDAKEMFIESIRTKNLTMYRKIAHKLRTNLKMLGLLQLESLIASGKELIESSDDSKLHQFSNTLTSNIDTVIEKVSVLRQEYIQ